MRTQILVFILIVAALSNLPCAEPQAIPGELITGITLEYRNGDTIEVNINALEIRFFDNKEGAPPEGSARKSNADHVNQVKDDLVKLIINGLSQGLATKESSDFISATIHFSGPNLSTCRGMTASPMQSARTGKHSEECSQSRFDQETVRIVPCSTSTTAIVTNGPDRCGAINRAYCRNCS